MPKRYKDDFTNERRLAYVRFTSQCTFRKESCEITFAEFCQFWHNETMWKQRGRQPNSLVLTRYDPTLPWNRNNCCIMPRKTQLDIRNKRRYNQQYLHLYKDAIPYAK